MGELVAGAQGVAGRAADQCRDRTVALVGGQVHGDLLVDAVRVSDPL
ncbi:hypothetical protein [Williamsia herbipolensis]|nr:hypothetical protein [Williamsia herbipolensis]